MSDIESEIDKLRRQVRDLELNTKSKIGVLSRKIEVLDRKNNGRDTVTPATAAQRHFTGHLDIDKRRIYIGDTIEFITSGRYDSTEGVVSGFTKIQVVSEDYKKREIKRAPHNVRVSNTHIR